MLKRFSKDRKGATAIEYGLIVALMALVLVSGAGAFGNAMNQLFSGNSSDLQQAFDR